MKLFLILFTIIVFFIVGVQEAHANTCDPLLSPQHHYRIYSDVSLAKVVEEHHVITPEGYEYEEYKLQALENYKGNLPDLFSAIGTYMGRGSTASFSMDLGVTYFLSGKANADGSMDMTDCGVFPVDVSDEYSDSLEFKINPWYVETHEFFASFMKQQNSIPSPIDQQRNGISFEYLECKLDLIPILRNDNSFACVAIETKEQLSKRGLISQFNNYYILMKQPALVRGTNNDISALFWIEGGDLHSIELKEWNRGINLRVNVNATDSGRLLMSIPNELFGEYFKSDISEFLTTSYSIGTTKAIQTDNKNTIFLIIFPSGETFSYISLYS